MEFHGGRFYASPSTRARFDQRRRQFGVPACDLHVVIKSQCDAHAALDETFRFSKQADVGVGHAQRMHRDF